MPGKHEVSILYVGDFSFPISWEAWKERVEATLNCRLVRETSQDLSGGLAQFSNFSCARLSRGWAVEAFGLFQANSPQINQVRYIDFIYKKSGTLWPHLLHKDAIHSLILGRQPYLNIKGAGLIVGISPEAILSAFVLAELGIKQITFVIDDTEVSESVLGLLKQSLFQIRFDVISADKVILLPGIYSVMICYEDLRQHTELLTALLYFNYLERGGLVINAGGSLEKIPLMEEASAIGAKVADLEEVQVHEEIMALRKILPLGQKNLATLLDSLSLNLK